MFTKKEWVFVIICIILFVGLVVFLPEIDGFISNKKEYEYDESLHSKVDRHICTHETRDTNGKTILEATFYISEENVTRIYTKESKTFTRKEDYDNALKTLEENKKTADYEVKITPDDTNYTIYTVKGINIKEGTSTNYPTNYEKLKEYLQANGYDCTVRYKN